MKQPINFQSNAMTAVVFGAVVIVVGAAGCLFESQARAQQMPATKPVAAATAAVDTQTLIERLPDQSHEMQDAGYHFENLWFAGNQQNWPLADYYLRKTRSYLQLAVQIKPVRKTSAGTEVALKAFLDSVDHGLLAQVDTAIQHQDVAGFRTAYRQTVEGCTACHTACEKAYLRVQVPNVPSTSIINFDPPAPSGQ